VQLGDAGTAKVEEAIVADLSLDKLCLRKLFPAQRATLFVNVLRGFSMSDNRLEAEQGDNDHDDDEGNCENCNGHLLARLMAIRVRNIRTYFT